MRVKVSPDRSKEYVRIENTVQKTEKVHMMEHLLPPPELPGALTESATLAASVKASLTPRFRLAEHS